MKFPRLAVIVPASLVILAVMFAGSPSKPEPGVYISEVCIHNDKVIHDSVGFYHDYVILSNSSEEEVSLKGYALSDNRSLPDRYILPDVRILPGETVMVWADSPSAFALYGLTYTDEDALYTGFRLSDREPLFLTSPDGSLADSFVIPVMGNDQALLRRNAGDAGTVSTPSLMKTRPPVISDTIRPPVLSVGSGYYDAPFSLSIDGAGYPVYYTVDGSDPYTSGKLYSAAFSVEDRSPLPDRYADIAPVSALYDSYVPTNTLPKATVIRAVARDGDGRFSAETVATFFVGEKIRSLCEGSYTMSLVSEPDGLFSWDRGIYVTGDTWDLNRKKAEELEDDLHYVPANYNMHGSKWRREAHLTLFAPSGACLYDENDLISIHGQSSRSLLQKGFNIRSKESGKKVFDGLFEDAGDTLMLRTGSENDVFLTNFRDALNARIAKDLKVASQASVCCQLYLNGEYWGCYNLQERLDASFIEKRYGIPVSNVNVLKVDPQPEPLSHLESDTAQYRELADFVLSHDLSDDNSYRRFCEMVDMDSLIDYYCAEMFFANDDAYYGNVGMWRARRPGAAPYEDGKWRFLLFDLDNTDGYSENTNADIDSFVDGSYIGYDPMEWDLFFSNLAHNPDFRKLVYDRFAGLLQSDFSYDNIAPVLDDMEAVYTKPMIQSLRRFGLSGADEALYHDSVETVRSFFRERGDHMSKYLMMHMGE